MELEGHHGATRAEPAAGSRAEADISPARGRGRCRLRRWGTAVVVVAVTAALGWFGYDR